MVFLVPFDGSPDSEAALARAVEHGQALGEDVVAVSIIPTGTAYAERRKWIQPDEDFAAETASAELRRKIAETTDDAERNFSESGAYSPDDGLTERVRQVARDVDASVLFVGASGDASDDRLKTPFGEVVSDAEYDIHVVRTA
ncbi:MULTISPECIES: universal stress protein [Salinibaculum]|uniref:universal stress protein n=1 Tax=Salinibaculum TaxID=2732368 RepID=UPI0030CEB5F7